MYFQRNALRDAELLLYRTMLQKTKFVEVNAKRTTVTLIKKIIR